MEIRTIKTEDLNPAQYNPRKDLQPGDPDYNKLKESLQQFGYVEPIVWNQRTGNVVGGHQRLKVLKQQGHEEIDVVVVDLDSQQEMALNLALNKIQSTWDLDALADVLTDLNHDGLMQLTGFEQQELDDITMDDDQFLQMLDTQQQQEPQHTESTTFSVTFVLPYEYTDMVDQYFLDVPNPKQRLTEAIILKVGGLQ